MAAQCLSLKARLSKVSSLYTTSPASKTLIGKECFLFSLMVFKIPGIKEVLTTWYSEVFGLANFTALESSELFKNLKGDSQDVGDLVDWQRRGTLGVTGLDGGLWQVVVTVGNGGIFHDISLVQDVWSGQWDFNVQQVAVGWMLGGDKGHLD
ncbi:hypothetical protein WICPIJ_008315 [Wickerhamomyces pijperi]|uniref:Uncharacterized protein n=1 Tax=Wickerhamomyces pijperi TaxID=599730 RepID=A0A9P8TIS7_WICPI|nr:hypothetical protein WICPIJ_008315 [Wickerhamomyces pijperi]